jgi:hypothetical protein
MGRLDKIFSKIPSVEKLDENNNKLHDRMNKLGWALGNAMKNLNALQGKLDTQHGKINLDSQRIANLHTVMETICTTFGSIKEVGSSSKIDTLTPTMYILKTLRQAIAKYSPKEVERGVKMISQGEFIPLDSITLDDEPLLSNPLKTLQYLSKNTISKWNDQDGPRRRGEGCEI